MQELLKLYIKKLYNIITTYILFYIMDEHFNLIKETTSYVYLFSLFLFLRMFVRLSD